MRALAVTAVLLFHAFPNWLPGGFVGVDVFFVISGYLITGIIRADIADGAFSFARFYGRRARRIFPALTVVVLATLALGWFLLLPKDFALLGKHALASALFVPNLLYATETGYFATDPAQNPLLHLWSLGVEEQFYLAWPLLLVALHKRRAWLVPALAAVVSLSFAYSAYATAHTPTLAFYSPLSRLWELGIGGLLVFVTAQIPFRRSLSAGGMLLIVGSACLLTESAPFPGFFALVPVAGAALMILGRSPVLAARPIVALGQISYPLYLWHWPLLALAAAEGWDKPAARVAVLAVAAALAWATWRLVERPIRFGRLHRRGALVAGAMLAASCAAGSTVYLGEGFSSRYPQAVRSVAEAGNYDPFVDGRAKDCWLYDAMPFEQFGADCRRGSIFVLGDSLAARLYTGLAKIEGDVGQFTRSSCWPVLTVGGGLCETSNAQAVQEILRLKPRRVIVFASWLAGDTLQNSPVVREQVRATIRTLRSGIEDVVVLGPSPEMKVVSSLELSGYGPGTGPRNRVAPVAHDYAAVDSILEKMAASEGARFVSLYKALCNREGCLSYVEGARREVIFFDGEHMTTDGAAFVAGRAGLTADLGG